MKKVTAYVNEEQYETIKSECKRREITIYAFVKEAILEKIYDMSSEDINVKKVKEKIQNNDAKGLLKLMKQISKE